MSLMRKTELTVTSNRPLTKEVFAMTLSGSFDTPKPGQFLSLSVPGFFLRRPVSIYDTDGSSVTILYKVVGQGTAAMAGWKSGDRTDVLLPLGQGYDLTKAGPRPLLVGGGVGIPPLYYLAKELQKEGRKVTALLGFRNKEEVICREAFEELGCRVVITTEDGSYGTAGFVTDALPSDHSFFYSCGPLPMLKALVRVAETDGQVSLEERMGCGFGACMGCSIETASGAKRICKDGPVFDQGELLWDR